VAKRSKVSEDTVAKVEKVLESGNEAVATAMLAGDKRINTAFKEAVPQPVKTWEIEDDIKRIRRLFDSLFDNWKTDEDRAAMRRFMKVLTGEI